MSHGLPCTLQVARHKWHVTWFALHVASPTSHGVPCTLQEARRTTDLQIAWCASHVALHLSQSVPYVSYKAGRYMLNNFAQCKAMMVCLVNCTLRIKQRPLHAARNMTGLRIQVRLSQGQRQTRNLWVKKKQLKNGQTNLGTAKPT